MSRGGDEHTLRFGDHVAVVTEVGGGLRSFTYAGRDLIRESMKLVDAPNVVEGEVGEPRKSDATGG